MQFIYADDAKFFLLHLSWEKDNLCEKYISLFLNETNNQLFVYHVFVIDSE